MSVERKLTPAARWVLGILLSIALLPACTRSAGNPTVVFITDGAPRIIVESVRVSQGKGIYFSGRTSLPQGECIQTELLADGKAEPWWPGDACIQPDETGQWELLVSLGRSGAPENLPTGVQYQLHAWSPEAPDATSTRFPFDLDSPPTPSS